MNQKDFLVFARTDRQDTADVRARGIMQISPHEAGGRIEDKAVTSINV